MSLWQNARSRQDDDSAVLERPDVSRQGGDVLDARPNRNSVPARPVRVVSDRAGAERADADEADGPAQASQTSERRRLSFTPSALIAAMTA